MQPDKHVPSSTFIGQWESQRDTPMSTEDIEARMHAAAPWEWRWTLWFGLTYGPVPVGMIIAAALAILLWR